MFRMTDNLTAWCLPIFGRLQVAGLKERLAGERREEESWKEEHRDISGEVCVRVVI